MTSFSLMRECKGISASNVYCCPTMDIVAIITTEHHVLVYQSVEWKKLLHIQPSDTASEATHVAWRPCGRTLAIGRRDGQVHLHDIEAEPDDSSWQSFENVSSYHHVHPIAALAWTNITDCNSSKMKDRTPSYVMNPPSSFSDTSTTYTPISPIPDEHHHVLASADTHGTILLHLWGNVCLARVDTSVTNIQHLYVLQDLSRVHVATITGQVVSYRLPTSTSKEILFVVAHHIREIQSLWAMITSALKQLKTEWGNGVRLFEAKFRLLPGEYAKYGCHQVPQMHMYTLLCSGLCYPALELFLSQYLQAQSIQKMQKTFAHGCDAVDTLLHEHAVAGASAVLFRLTELRGLARSYQSLESIGMSTSALSDLIEATEGFLLQLNRMQCAVRDTAVNMGLFLDWIAHTSASVTNKTRHGSSNPVDTQRLGRFLNHAYHVAVAHRKAHPNDMELTFGNPMPSLIDGIGDANTRVVMQWTRLLAKSTSAPPICTLVRQASLPHSSVLFGPQWTLCFQKHLADVHVYDTTTWDMWTTPSIAPPFHVVQASMYIRESCPPRVAVVVSNGDQAYLQLVPMEGSSKHQRSPCLEDAAPTDEAVRTREVGSAVVALAANGMRGVLCVLSHTSFAMYDGECDDEEIDQQDE